MSGIAIKVENLSKLYKIGARQNRYDTLRDRLVDAFTSPFRRYKANKHNSPPALGSPPSASSSVPSAPSSSLSADTIWALRDVSFDVKHGEVVGIIGRNGAGKSTLLKILSRITEPTKGRAIINGRVGSLLEVGTGFHPELTGRENIYLNGAILGMKKQEIDRKFDEIVAFAEIEKFLDTPVKHYSSGMYVRLAFAVAAHLEPEILLVDEVLSVGDAAFQKKCLGKMGDVAKEGRTVLFVSHNMQTIRALCSRAILIHDGWLAFASTVNDVVDRYISPISDFQPVVHFSESTLRRGTGEGRITSLEFQTLDGTPMLQINARKPLKVLFGFEARVSFPRLRAGILIRDQYDKFLCDIRGDQQGKAFAVESGKRYLFEMVLDTLPLYPGTYVVGVWVARSMSHGEDIDYIPDACALVIEDNEDLLASGFRLDPNWGQFFVDSHWRQIEVSV